MTNTTALATQNETQLSQQVQKTAVDPEIIALASAFFTTGEMTKEQAVKAAYFFYQTGHVEGRDDYIGTTGGVRGKVLEGYRGVQREVGRDYEVKYRQPTDAEMKDHGIDPKGRALVCEVYVLDIWQRKQAMGLPYEPITGMAYYAPGVKINVPATKTEHWVLQKNARKDALRQVPGAPLDASEAIEEAEAAGLHIEAPEGAQLTTEQVRLMIEQAQADATRPELTYEQHQGRLQVNVAKMRGPEWNAFDEADGEYRVEELHSETQPAQPVTNGAQDATPADLPFRPTVEGAIEWACTTAPQVWATNSDGTIVTKMVEASFRKLQKTLTGRPLMDAWIAKVNDKAATFAASHPSETTTDDADGWAELDAAGHDADDEPKFS